MVLRRSNALHIHQAVGIAVHCRCDTPGKEVIRIVEDALFYSIAVSFDLYQFTMMDKAINGGRSKGVVVVQDAAPISERAVGGDNNGPTFIPVRDDLKQEFGALLVHGEIA